MSEPAVGPPGWTGRVVAGVALPSDEETTAVACLLILRDRIKTDTNYDPATVMLPLHLLPRVTKLYGLPVIRGDRIGLIYDAAVILDE